MNDHSPRGANGTDLRAAVVKDLLVALIGVLSRSDLDEHLASPARSRIVRAMSCAHGGCFLAPSAAPQPDPRAPPSCFPGWRKLLEKCFPSRVSYSS